MAKKNSDDGGGLIAHYNQRRERAEQRRAERERGIDNQTHTKYLRDEAAQKEREIREEAARIARRKGK